MVYNKLLSDFVKDILKDGIFRTLRIKTETIDFIIELSEYCKEHDLVLYQQVNKRTIYFRVFTKSNFQLYETLTEDSYTMKYENEE